MLDDFDRRLPAREDRTAGLRSHVLETGRNADPVGMIHPLKDEPVKLGSGQKP
jgi:hypothetical protein